MCSRLHDRRSIPASRSQELGEGTLGDCVGCPTGEGVCAPATTVASRPNRYWRELNFYSLTRSVHMAHRILEKAPQIGWNLPVSTGSLNNVIW